MRRRRIAFMLRAMVMAVPSIIPACGNQTRTDEAERTTPPVINESEAARAAGQPINGIVSKGGQNPRLKGGISTEALARERIASPRPADAR